MSFLAMGNVYGTLMNFRGEHDALGAAMNAPPYKAPPRAPVLYVKPANTWSADGAEIALPAGVPEVEVGAALGMVLKAPGDIAGYVLFTDLSLPQTSYYRPPVKSNCLDGFLGVGRSILRAEDNADAWQVDVTVSINGEVRRVVSFAHLVRSPAQLLADVSEFMTLKAGDVLLLGCDADRPRAKAGDRIELSGPGLGTLANTLVAEAA